jgi:hypothetical protein
MHHPISFLSFASSDSTHVKNHNLFTPFLNAIQDHWFGPASLVPADITKIITLNLSTLSSPSIVCFDCSMKEVGYTAILLNT